MSFNGAAAGQPRKDLPIRVWTDERSASMGPRLDSRGRTASANRKPERVAASMGPRLDSRGRAKFHARVSAALELQWGRGWTAAEGTPPTPPTPPAIPLQWGRGWTAAEGAVSPRAAPRPTCFNGAAAGQPRKGLPAAASPVERWPLQWGRGWTAAEGAPRSRGDARCSRFNGAAAGQPRKDGRS